MTGTVAYVLSKSYTDNSIKGISGALAGKNCTISKTEAVEGGTKVTFAWTANDGTAKTTSIIVKDGEQGKDAPEPVLKDTPMTEEQVLALLVADPNKMFNGFFYNSDLNAYCSFSGLYMKKTVSGENVHYGYCEIRGVHETEYLVDYRIDWEDSDAWYKVKVVTEDDLIDYGKKEDVMQNTSDISALNAEVQANTSDIAELAEDVGKDKVDINDLKTAIKSLSSSVTLKFVDELPTEDIKTNYIYLLATATEGQYDQYIYDSDNASWVSLGVTSIDLTEYTKQVYLTEAEYLALVEAGTVDPTKDYNTYEA